MKPTELSDDFVAGWRAGRERAQYETYELAEAYCAGWCNAHEEIAAGTASHKQAKERDIYPGDQLCRIEWDVGYQDCVTAYILGHDIDAMAKAELFGPSLLAFHAVAQTLLAGAWDGARPDPREEA